MYSYNLSYPVLTLRAETVHYKKKMQTSILDTTTAENDNQGNFRKFMSDVICSDNVWLTTPQLKSRIASGALLTIMWHYGDIHSFILVELQFILCGSQVKHITVSC